MLSVRRTGHVSLAMAKKLLVLNPSLLPSARTQAPTRTVLPRRVSAYAAGGDSGKESNRSAMALADDPAKAEPLPSLLKQELLPRHVAIIMDGNSRWARHRGLPVWSGHEAGTRALQELTGLCGKWGIRVLTVFAFSSENWLRPKEEVDFLMSLLERHIESQLQIFSRHGLRISIIGDQSKLPESTKRMLAEAEQKTRDSSGLHLVYAISYSGKSDIAQACRRIAHRVNDGAISLEDIDEGLIEDELATSRLEFPRPDLLIRTSGELRLSNFLLWQSAYTELFFSPALWPDFGEAEFVEALCSFQQRQRRYGARNW